MEVDVRISKTCTIYSKYGHCCYEFKNDYTHIYNLYVFPEFRRQGRATELLQKAIDLIRKLGYAETIQIVASPINDCIDTKKLCEFYERMGLEVYSFYG